MARRWVSFILRYAFFWLSENQAVSGFVKDAIGGAMADAQAQAILAKTLQNTTGARKRDVAGVEAWINSLTLATGVADDELRPALGSLLRATGKTTKAQSLLKTAMSASAATGKPLATVSLALAKAATGNTGALGRLGINMKDADGKALSFKDSVKKLNDQFGGAQAAKTKTFAGQVDVLKNRWNELKETIGAAVLPVLGKVVSFINDNFGPAVDFVKGLFQKGGVAGEYYGTIIDGIREAIAGVTRAYMEHKPQIDLFIQRMIIIAKTVGPPLARFLGTVLTTSIKVVGKAFEIVIGVISKLVEWTPAILRDFIKPVVLGFVTFAEVIVSAAAIAFGWIPGIGDKLQRAREAISNFKKDTEHKFNVWAENLSKQGEAAGAGFVRGLNRGLKSGGITKGSTQAQRNAMRNINVPHLASGGIVSRPTLALIGERGPEAVVPLSRGRAPGLGQVTIHVDARGATDPAAVERAARRGAQVAMSELLRELKAS